MSTHISKVYKETAWTEMSEYQTVFRLYWQLWDFNHKSFMFMTIVVKFKMLHVKNTTPPWPSPSIPSPCACMRNQTLVPMINRSYANFDTNRPWFLHYFWHIDTLDNDSLIIFTAWTVIPKLFCPFCQNNVGTIEPGFKIMWEPMCKLIKIHRIQCLPVSTLF